MSHALAIQIRRLAALARLGLVAGMVALGSTGCHVNWNLAPTNRYYNGPERTNDASVIMPPPPVNLQRFAPEPTEAAIVAPPPVVIVRWSNANPQPVSFDVFGGSEPDVDAMALRVNTTNLYAEFPANQTQEFFAVRARRGTNVSRWGTK